MSRRYHRRLNIHKLTPTNNRKILLSPRLRSWRSPTSLFQYLVCIPAQMIIRITKAHRKVWEASRAASSSPSRCVVTTSWVHFECLVTSSMDTSWLHNRAASCTGGASVLLSPQGGFYEICRNLLWMCPRLSRSSHSGKILMLRNRMMPLLKVLILHIFALIMIITIITHLSLKVIYYLWF